MNTKRILLGMQALTLTLGLFVQSPAFADQTTVQEVTETGPAQVVDSWMEPKIVRTKEIKDADGNTTVVKEPLVQERHEKVIVPTNKTTFTTTVHQEPAVVKTVERRYVAAAPKRAVKKKVRKARKVAHKPKPRKAYVASREIVRQEVVPAETTVIQRTDSQDSEAVYERRHPALEIIH
ncbi:MAG: hypothetical protein SFY67_11355 [Candidatus Melainabacteria bacterium]|nr:hypothetical protein [Candidatus Melainabacteria bacterium]